MRCDLHVHTRNSGMCGIPLLHKVCRESYNEAGAVYDKLKRLGMDLVTVTDHNSIDALEELRSRPDFFVSEEVTCTLPSGTEMHIGVYNITERDHVELQRRRHDFESFSAYVAERRVFCSANHVFSSLTGRRRVEDFLLFEMAFDAIETRNGHMLALSNNHAARLAGFAGRAEVGGSDAHSMASVGCTYTVVPGARNRDEYLAGLRCGFGEVRGETGRFGKLTREVLSIGAGMVRENPCTAPVAALGVLVPLVIWGNYVVERLFSRYWMDQYLQARARRDSDHPVAEAVA